MRVKRRLYGPHGPERGAVLSDQILPLALSDSMLARARSVHADRAFGEAFQEILDRRHLLGVTRIDHRLGMEVAIAHVAYDPRRDPHHCLTR